MKAKLYTDGGSRNNPGPAAIGVVLLDEQGVTIETVSKFLGQATNNQAEYEALLHGLRLALHHKVSQVAVYLDSELVVKQMQGLYKIKDSQLAQLAAQAKTLLESFQTYTFIHIPREKNAAADALVNQALDAAEKS